MSQTCDQKRFTISEVAADWHELMIPQRTMRPSIARISKQLDPRFAASRHTTVPVSHARPSPLARKLLIPLSVGGSVDLSTQWWVSNLFTVACKWPAVRFELQS